MKICFITFDSFFPARHGGARELRGMVEAFANAGHQCHVAIFVSSSQVGVGEWPLAQQKASLCADFDSTGLPHALAGGELSFRLDGIEYKGITVETGDTIRQVLSLLDAEQPDALVVTDGQHPHCASLLRELACRVPDRLIYCPKTVHLLPVGPFSICPDAGMAELLAGVALIVPPSRFVADTISSVVGRKIEHFYFPVYEAPKLDYATRPTAQAITLINASILKGVTIFADLVASLEGARFAAVPGWGTTASELNMLRSTGKVVLLPFSKFVDSVYLPTKILVVPSLCYEALGHVVIEAMLRGIVVVASTHGGLREAKLGVEFKLPVSPVRVERIASEGSLCLRVPTQNTGNWKQVLTNLLEDRDMYAMLSEQSRLAASGFVKSLSWVNLLKVVEEHIGFRLPRTARLSGS